MAAAQEIHRLEMDKARRTDFAAISLVGAVRDEIDAELALGRLDGRVNLASRHVEALCVKLEMLDERFHRALHVPAIRGHHLTIRRRDRPLAFGRAQLVDALPHDAYAMAHLLH